MAKCYNKNLPEYQSLSEEFKDNMVVDSLIEKWQSLNNSEEFPTVEQAKQVQEFRFRTGQALNCRKFWV